MKRKKIIRVVLLLLLLFCAGGALYIYREYNRKNKDLKKVQPAFFTAAGEFIREFNNNEPASNAKYLGKVISVNGTLRESAKDERGFYTLVLGGPGDMSSIRCSMDSSHAEELKNITIGSPISIKGICTGSLTDPLLGTDILLNRAVLEKN